MASHQSTSIRMRTSKKLVPLNIVVSAIAVLVGTLVLTQSASATPPSGLTALPLASGDLLETQRVKFKGHHGGFSSGTEVSTISVVRYNLDPGGTFGWHQHGGPLWVVVAEGELTFYRAEAGCTGQLYTAGSAFLDPGDMTHTARNEGNEPLVVFVAFMLPEGAPPRIDVPDPGVCPF